MLAEAAADDRPRCAWALSTPDYIALPRRGVGHGPARRRRALRAPCLEAFQSGLSWLTILRKRPAFRRAFDGFAIEKVAAFGESDVERLMADASIVRNRAKITAAIDNARVAAALDGGLDELMWSFAPTGPRLRPVGIGDVPAVTAESTAMAKD